MKLFPVLVLIVSLYCSAPVYAFKPVDHASITKEALSQISENVNGRQIRFSMDAINDITESNIRTDDIAFQSQSDLHFDNEDFLGGSKRLVRWRERVIKKVAGSRNGRSARVDLGSALHTIQDFYAHSNWVELGRDNINSDLGRKIFTGAGPTVATCPMNPGQLGGQGLQELTSGYFLISQGLCGVPTGKCRHGVDILCPEGLNKDSNSNPLYQKAKNLATLASIDYVRQVLSDPVLSQSESSLLLLFGETQ
jgi:hypothetical protein